MLMCFGVLSGTVIVYLIVLTSTHQWWGYRASWVYAGILSSLAFAGGWTMVWRGAILWTAHRRILTLLLIPLGLVPAALGFVAGEAAIRHSNGDFGVFLGTLAWATTWLIGTATIWRENAKERGERLRSLGIHAVACPDCGYNLTGLREAKCPECGAAYTLDQLYATITEQRAELGGD
jgi:hypothetical protein